MNLAQIKKIDPYKLPGAHKCEGDKFYHFLAIAMFLHR